MKRFYQLLFCFSFSFLADAQELLPFVENFTKSEYSGDNQVWSISQAADHSLYFANNNYLLRYNGAIWQKAKLPNKTIIRSVLAQKNRLYCGSYNEFGYWMYVKGSLIYKSLSAGKNLFKGNTLNEEIWKIFEYKGAIYFQSFNSIFIYNGKTIKTLKLPFQISYCFTVGEELWYASTNNGCYRFNGKNFEQIPLGDLVLNNVIHHAADYEGLKYIFTLKNGVFYGKTGNLRPWTHPLNLVLKKELILCARFLSKDRLAIGTASNGLYLVNLQDGSFRNISRENGLGNNSVLQIQTDTEGDLWLGLDNGISHVEINSNFEFFTDNSGKLGSVYAINGNRDELLIGSNHGLYSYNNKNLRLIPQSQGQVWSIEPFGDSFAIGHNDGTFLYSKNDFRRLNTVTGGWKFMPDNYDPVIFMSHYAGILAFKKPFDLKKYDVINNITKPIKNLVQSKKGQLWAADAYKGLYRIDYDATKKVYKVTDISKVQKLKNDYAVKMLQFRDSTYIKVNNSWFTPDAKTGLLVSAKAFSATFKDVNELVVAGKDALLAVKNTQLYLIHSINGRFIWSLIPEKYYRGRLINQDTKIFMVGSNYLLNLDDGFIQISEVKNTSQSDKIRIEAWQNNNFLTSGTKIGYKKAVEVRVLHKYFGQNSATVYYRIDDEEMNTVSNNNTIILNNLESGDHTIRFYTIRNNTLKTVAEFAFEVSRPWYLSGIMLLIYACTLGLILFGYYKWNQIRYKQRLAMREEEIRHQNELRTLELEAQNTLRIQEYEKHILEIQVQTKASEVASKSLAIAKHSEIIEAVSAALEQEQDLLKLKSKIKKAIKSNSITQKEWENFEQNLLQSHADFVKRLSNNYPQLTPKDIKLSIYLKMNLSSKEIAPLMSITYRGVEIHRYRLRKKLALDADINLNRFMNTV